MSDGNNFPSRNKVGRPSTWIGEGIINGNYLPSRKRE